MHDFTTELAQCLTSGMDATEFFRHHLEKAINHLLGTERTVFFDYEKWDPVGYNSGNLRNGYYTRSLKTIYGTLDLQIHLVENVILRYYTDNYTLYNLSEVG